MAQNIGPANVEALPQYFVMQGEGNSVEQIDEPCYRCLSPQYLGDTWYDEGEIITTHICPNYELQPLNKAAGDNFNKWLATLPLHGEKMDLADVVEAATRLRDHPSLKEMTDEDVHKTVHELALKIRRKREEGNGMYVPPVSANEARRAGRAAAPAMPNTRFTDPTLADPGNRDRAVLHEPVRGPSPAARVKPPLNNATRAAAR